MWAKTFYHLLANHWEQVLSHSISAPINLNCHGLSGMHDASWITGTTQSSLSDLHTHSVRWKPITEFLQGQTSVISTAILTRHHVLIYLCANSLDNSHPFCVVFNFYMSESHQDDFPLLLQWTIKFLLSGFWSKLSKEAHVRLCHFYPENWIWVVVLWLREITDLCAPNHGRRSAAQQAIERLQTTGLSSKYIQPTAHQCRKKIQSCWCFPGIRRSKGKTFVHSVPSQNLFQTRLLPFSFHTEVQIRAE